MTAHRIRTKALLAMLGATGCTPQADRPAVNAQSSYSTVEFGNGASLPGNAGSLPGNGASLPGNGSSLPGNGSSLPGNGGANIIAAESFSWMVKPRETIETTCGGYPLSTDWELAASYRCGGTGRIHTSDIEVDGVKLGASLCSQCGTSAPPRIYLPATLANLDGSVTRDVILRIDYRGASVYECAQDDYAVMVYDLSISYDDCGTFSTSDLVTAVPAPHRLFSGVDGLVPRGEGWGLIAPATTNSAVFKAAHYTKMVTTFYPERDDAWQYNYPTTNTACDDPDAACLSGASMLLGYALSLANLAPVVINGTVYGVAGTVTGVPTWLSILTSTGDLKRTYLEVGFQHVSNDYVLPGPVELSATPYPYDAVHSPGEHMFSSTRAAYGPNTARVDLAREAFCGSLESCEDATVHAALFTNYTYGQSQSPASENLKINQLFAAVAGSANFIVSAMPQPGATASCSTPDQRRGKHHADLPGPDFCIPTGPTHISTSEDHLPDAGADAAVDAAVDAGIDSGISAN